jgi:hypothetical protein
MKRFQFRIPALAFATAMVVATVGWREARATSLVAYYPFDGNGNDASGNGYNLTLYGGVGFAAGLFGQALDLHHNNSQYAARPVSDPAFDFGSSNFTVSIWANFYDTSGEQTLIEKWDGASGPGWTLTKLDGNALRFATSFDPGGILNSSPLTIATGTWHDIVVRRDGADWTLDFDG